MEDELSDEEDEPVPAKKSNKRTHVKDEDEDDEPAPAKKSKKRASVKKEEDDHDKDGPAAKSKAKAKPRAKTSKKAKTEPEDDELRHEAATNGNAKTEDVVDDAAHEDEDDSAPPAGKTAAPVKKGKIQVASTTSGGGVEYDLPTTTKKGGRGRKKA
jgi:hypothetical protein